MLEASSWCDRARDGWVGDEQDPPVRARMSLAVRSVAVDASLAAVRSFMDSSGVDCVPVVQMGALVGMVSKGDLCAAANAGCADATPVRSLMKRGIPAVHPDGSLAQADEILWAGRYAALPVVDDGVIVGVLTAAELLGAGPPGTTGASSSPDPVERRIAS